MKKIIFLIATLLFCKNSQAQYPNPFLVGYWQNWDEAQAPFIPLTSIPQKYNVVNVAFATASDLKGQMTFTPTAPYTPANFISDMNTIKGQRKKVVISIGGSVAHGGRINLTDVVDRDNFINSINNILNQYPFDGIDIDLEQDCLKFDQSGTLTDTKSPSIDNLIFAIKSIMQTYRTKNGKKMLLSLAPEQNHVSGSLGAHSYLVEPHSDAYLPVLEQLKDSIDAVFPQMYGINIIGPTTNDRTGIFGIDGILYFSNTIDNYLAMADELTQGFQTKKWITYGNPSGTRGTFSGLPASKVGFGIASCDLAANYGYPGNTNIGTSFTDSISIRKIIHYLSNKQTKPASYTKVNATAYQIGGLMTWSINYDLTTCSGAPNFVSKTYDNIFSTVITKSSQKEILTFSIPNQKGSTQINSISKTIEVTMLIGTNLSSLIPTYTISPKATSSPASGLAQNFNSNVIYTVIAEDNSTQQWTVKVKLDTSASIENNSQKNLLIFPNPFENELNIKSSNQLNKMEIYTSIGKKIVDINDIDIDTKINTVYWTKGIYLLKTTLKNGDIQIQKLIK